MTLNTLILVEADLPALIRSFFVHTLLYEPTRCLADVQFLGESKARWHRSQPSEEILSIFSLEPRRTACVLAE